MVRLVYNEIYKVFHKKGTIIFLFLMLGYIVLTNYIYKTMDINSNYYVSYGDEEHLEYLKNEIANFDKEKGSMSKYANLLAEKEQEEFVLKNANEWQVNKYYTYVADKINQYYNYLYVNNDEEKASKLREQIDDLIFKLDSNNWRYFVNLELEQVNENIKYTEENNQTLDSNRTLKAYEYNKYLLNYRLQNDVGYSDNYLSQTIENQTMLLDGRLDYEYAKTEELKKSYQGDYAEFMENQYILDNKVDTNNMASVRGILADFYNEYGFLIIIFVIMIAGTIVSDEFHRGTIKSLLTIPYKRSTILRAKFITVLIMLVFIILFFAGGEMLFGGIFFGFKDLAIPVVGYNFKIGAIETINVFKYFLLNTLYLMPKIILLATLAFSLSTLICSNAFAITLSLCGYIASDIINSLFVTYNLNFLKYFVTPNWDLTYLLFNQESAYGISLVQSLITCLIYYLVMIITAKIVFKKRNIKNI